jgi:hypothetical protein
MYVDKQCTAPALNKEVHFLLEYDGEDDFYECSITEWDDILGWRIEGDNQEDVNICKFLPSLCVERVYLVCNEYGYALPDLDEYGRRLPE